MGEVIGDLVLLVVTLGAACAAWWLGRDLRTVPADSGPGPGVRVAVIIPARNEEATLPALLGSLQRLRTGPELDVVVVDDASKDATADVGRSGGATVLPAGTPPPGWTGKAWACHVGSRAAGGELLLFLDADTVLAPDALSGLLTLHDRHRGLVSVQPFHEVGRPYEHLSAYFNVVALLATGAFARRPSRRAVAYGPCLLTSRTDYERVGGHAAVRGEILDDVELAAAYQRAGLPVRCWIGGPAIRMRSYPGGIRQLADGWTKNIASGASASPPVPTVLTALWISAHHAVAVGTVISLAAATTGWGTRLDLAHPVAWGMAWAALAWQLGRLLRPVGSFGWWTWALFPVPLLAFDLVFARSAAQTVLGRSVTWRGRAVDLDRGRSSEGVS